MDYLRFLSMLLPFSSFFGLLHFLTRTTSWERFQLLEKTLGTSVISLSWEMDFKNSQNCAYSTKNTDLL